jgi:exodeoxyribonuclease V alpha subunit
LLTDINGIRKYLGNGLIESIGKIYVDKIVDKFGIKTFEIISSESDRLREILDIDPMQSKSIKRS